jgi:thiamine biosynthesis lipoprotein
MTSIAGQERLLVEQKQRIMATEVTLHLAVAPQEEARAHAALDSCVAWLREVERCLTRFNPASELCQLNRHAGQWRAVSTLLFTVVREALAAARASDGLFDPALLPHLEALGYDRDFALLARLPAESAAVKQQITPPPGAWREIKLDVERQRILLPRGTRLDLGGITKGWAADKALKRLLAYSSNVLVNVGGDIRLRGGPQPGESWAVGIGDLDATGGSAGAVQRAIVTFAHGGLATSGAGGRWWYHQGERQHHILDPRTGRPASLWLGTADAQATAAADGQVIAMATALAETAAHAEVAAKVALLRGYPAALRAIEQAWAGDAQLKTDKGVALLLVLGNGEVVVSSNMEEYLATCGGGGMLWL